MVFQLRRHRVNDAHREKSLKFFDSEYKWSNQFRFNELNTNAFHITATLQPECNESSAKLICQAKHEPSNHEVVIKFLNLDSEETLDWTRHEIITIRQLRHPNLLPLLYSFVSERHLCNVFTFAYFGSVDVWAKPNGMPELVIAFIIRDVLFALDYLHKRGIIHRAVCGSHILVNSCGSCMLTGLKYSTSVLKDGRWHSTVHEYPKNAVRILKYLAPEILEQNLLGYNSKSDIYSLGIVCCELANGCVPFEDIPLTEMLLDKLTGNFPRPLDSTCDEIRNFPTDIEDLTPEVREKYEVYRNRTFSAAFHKFTIEHCLNFDICSRPTAGELLANSFIKQAKKSRSNLLELLSPLPGKVSQFSASSVANPIDKLMSQLNVKQDCDEIAIEWHF